MCTVVGWSRLDWYKFMCGDPIIAKDSICREAMTDDQDQSLSAKALRDDSTANTESGIAYMSLDSAKSVIRHLYSVGIAPLEKQ